MGNSPSKHAKDKSNIPYQKMESQKDSWAEQRKRYEESIATQKPNTQSRGTQTK